MHHNRMNYLKQRKFFIILAFAFSISNAWALSESACWPSVSTGDYQGYAEVYSVEKGSYVIEGDTNLGVECNFYVSKKGVKFNGSFYSWDAPGLQASREMEGRHERINFRGRLGSVIVADLVVEIPKGTIVQVIRMAVALKVNESDKKRGLEEGQSTTEDKTDGSKLHRSPY